MAPITIAIASTFTAEPLEASLCFWLQELEIEANIRFAPLGQMLHQLLDRSSLLSNNRQGVNVLLVRLEDWARSNENRRERGAAEPIDAELLDQNIESFISAVSAVQERSSSSYLVYLCPSSATGSRTYELLAGRIAAALDLVPDVYVIKGAELTAAYPVVEIFDTHGDRLALIPFTPEFYIALGTMIARKIYALRNSPYKVIAFDADQTLWSGVCGEEGPFGVAIDPSRQAIQEFLTEQNAAGMLLCLCSMNHEDDVAAIFECRPEMILRRDQIVGWRANWRPKSENLRALAGELQLGLESFIFLDDDPVACAEVQANCPEVLTLVLPQNPAAIAPFLRNIWAFDHPKVTGEGAGRTALYRQNLERRQLQRESLTLKDFLAGLRLKVEFAPLAPQHLARLSELTWRTNQFNTTTIRHSEAELQSLCAPKGRECLVVHAKDRFGDYGLVGAMICSCSPEALLVEELLLSCRALGRGVEHRMLAKIGEIALLRGVPEVAVRFLPSPKNQPAFDFLNSIESHSKEVKNDEFLFRILAKSAANLRYDPPVGNATDSPVDHTVLAPARITVDTRTRAARLSAIATELSDIEQIKALITAQTRVRPDLAVPFAPPGTDCERKLAAMFAELLGVEQVGINDNFFSLGGHSLLATMLISRIRDTYQIELPITVLFEIEFTVAELAQTIGKYQLTHAEPQDTDEMLQYFESLSPNEVRVLMDECESPRTDRGGGE